MSPIYGIAYSKAAWAFFEKRPKKIRRQIRRKVERLLKRPHPPTARVVKSASGTGGKVLRVRSGDYRILYSVREGPEITVLDIDHRKKVYRGAKKHKRKRKG